MANVLMVKDIEGMVVQVSRNESFDHSMGISSFPVETGLDVTDHASVEPVIFDITFSNSNADITAGQSNPAIISESYRHMVQIQNTLKKATIITGIAAYSDMLLVGMRAVRKNKHGNVIEFTCAFAQVRYAQASQLSESEASIYARTNGGNSPPAPDAPGSRTDHKGTSNSSDADDKSKDTPKKQSALKSIIGDIFE